MERTNKKIIVDGFKKITDYRIKKVEDNYIWVVTGSNFFDFGNECSVIDFDGNVLFDDIDELHDYTYIGNNIFKYGLFHYYNYYIVDNHKTKLLDGVKDIKNYDNFMTVNYNDYAVLTDNNFKTISNKYDSIGEFYEGYAIVDKKDKCGLIDKTGKEIIKPVYDEILNIKFDYITLRSSDEFIIVDKLGNTIKRFKMDNNTTNIIYFDYDTYLVRSLKKDYIMDSNKKKIYKAKRNERLILNPNGDFILAHKRNRKYSKLIYKNGQTMTDIKFDYIVSFYGNVGILTYDDKYGLVYKNHIMKSSFDYACLEHLTSNLFKFSLDKKIYGIMDESGKVVLNNYTNLKLEYGYIIGTKEDMHDVIDNNGKVKLSISKEYVIENIVDDLILLKKLDPATKNTFFHKFFYKVIYKDGSEFIPLVSSEIFLMNNSKMIIDNHLVDLNSEYIDFKYEIVKERDTDIKDEPLTLEMQKIKNLLRHNK